MPSVAVTEQALGASMAEVVRHLEKTMPKGASWKRLDELHIDHIVPLAWKDENGRSPSPATILERMHYSNTQLLYAKDNLKKGCRWIG